MAPYRYEVWEIVDGDNPSHKYKFRIIEYFAVCDGGMRARITDKSYTTLHEAKIERQRLEGGQSL